jgi:O-methyltransferase
MPTINDRFKHYLIRKLDQQLRRRGFSIVSTRNDRGTADIDTDEEFLRLYDFCRPYTLTSKERMYALYCSIKYVHDNEIPGDIVECGVWKGGSMMLAAKLLKDAKSTDRRIYFYDTFKGMTEPTDDDVDLDGVAAAPSMKKALEKQDNWGGIPIEEVQENLSKVGYPRDNLVFVKGDVCQTIPDIVPEKISVLRLDTDWYESTRHELLHLYPLLSPSGVLLIDDYGHYQGARKATDEFLDLNRPLLLSRIDYTCRLTLKPAA